MSQPPSLFALLVQDFKRESSQAKDLNAFPALASSLLENFRYDHSLNELNDSVADWLSSSKVLPEQINLHNTFGQPPLTIFNNGQFVFDLYFWIGCDTSIHSHGFRGAFRVLHGASLHETFRVRTDQIVSHDVELTALGQPEVELLMTGDVRTIAPGKELTHRVIHLEEPTVTLCLKTINEPALPQWHHFTEGLAIQKRHLDQGLIKQIYYYQYLRSQDEPSASRFLTRLIEREDISTLLNLAEMLSLGSLEISEELTQIILEEIYAIYGETTWFDRYECSLSEPPETLPLDLCHSSLQRLAAHLANEKMTFKNANDLIAQLVGKTVSKKEIGEMLISLATSPEHRELIRNFLV